MSTQTQIPDRRPIAARNTRWAHRTAHALARRGISPNAISIAGMIAGILAGCALAATKAVPFPAQRGLWLLGAAFVQLRLLANMLDGMVAMETGTSSAVGELYNEVPDRVSDAAALIGLGYASGGSPALGYIAACLALFTAYVRAQGKAAGARSEFCGPMAKQQRMFTVTIVAIFMASAPVNWHLRFGPGASWGPPAASLALIALGCIVTTWRRLARIRTNLTELAR